jgi:hypothetical protein
MFAGGVHDRHLSVEIQVVSARLYLGQHSCQLNLRKLPLAAGDWNPPQSSASNQAADFI